MYDKTGIISNPYFLIKIKIDTQRPSDTKLQSVSYFLTSRPISHRTLAAWTPNS